MINNLTSDSFNTAAEDMSNFYFNDMGMLTQSGQIFMQPTQFINNKLSQPYLQQKQVPAKIFQPSQLQPQIQYGLQQQTPQFKNININDEIVSPLSNSSSSSSSSLSCSSSSSMNNLNPSFKSASVNGALTGNSSNSKLDNSFEKVSNKMQLNSPIKCNQIGSNSFGANKKSNKKKNTQITNDIDEERTSQLVSELLRNIKEKTKELESLNQNLKTTG